ncbi:NUDIX hydrolase, partial [Algoriphagus aestuarii]|nr:NUDIX hydrolase [Algoriphagus aestuarii]
LYSVDESGTGHVLLQHRAPWTHQGGTWGLPGGARNSGESSVSAAIREFVEEVDGDLGTLSLLGIHRQDHQVWVFDTVLASVPERRPFTPGNPESESIRWIPVPDVPSMPLLPAFGKVWPEVAAALSEQLLLIVDTT